ncbi:MAG: flp pilus-assembly TadE/G-like family protein [Propionibacteriaceae bacterium]|nr:flp pilus-assembly TadE/G-like family protein [Propionibacteriaceae bacterium]
MRTERDNGVGTPLAVLGILALAIAIFIIGAILVHVVAIHKAQSISDLAALAAATAATASYDDHQACTKASEVAQANGARLTSCEIQRAGVEVAAAVEVMILVTWKIPGLPQEANSTSYAGNPSPETLR